MYRQTMKKVFDEDYKSRRNFYLIYESNVMFNLGKNGVINYSLLPIKDDWSMLFIQINKTRGKRIISFNTHNGLHTSIICFFPFSKTTTLVLLRVKESSYIILKLNCVL